MHSEAILVLPRIVLEENNFIAAQPGLLWLEPARAASFENLAARQAIFAPRSLMEQDPAYKQIIPYMAFVSGKRLFVMQRSAGAGEQRLASKYTVGIGGHVRQEDMQSGGLVEWGMREFEEEVAYVGRQPKAEWFGLVNDDRDLVGQVHIGAVLLLTAESVDISVRSELASGVMMTREECLAVLDRMETWSQFVVKALIERGVI